MFLCKLDIRPPKIEENFYLKYYLNSIFVYKENISLIYVYSGKIIWKTVFTNLKEKLVIALF